MRLTGFVLALSAMMLAGCASQPPQQVLGYQSRGQTAPTGSLAPSATIVEPRTDLKKTLASRMLAAIALERVTGRKPDPARLAEVR